MDSNTLSSLYLLPKPNLAPENYLKAFKSISPRFQGSSVPWELAVPEKAYKAIKNDKEAYEKEIKELDLGYYYNIFIPTNEIFNFLKQSKIDKEKFSEYVKNDLAGHVETFKPDAESFSSAVEYDRLATVTGRLKTVSGPKILHLQKKFRNMIESRWKNGKIIALDYKSLEPRVLLSVSGTQPDIEKDIYTQIKDQLFKSYDSITRDVVKKIILAELYGAGNEYIRNQLSEIRDIEWVINQIRIFFGLEKVKDTLYKEWIKTDKKYVTNLYGRRIKTENSHTLINHYVQSTAVDVSLLGFLNIINFIKEIDHLNDIIPLFILHDAIILDVNENALNLLPALCKVGATDIKKLENNIFYMSIDKEFANSSC